MADKPDISVELLRQLLRYEPETGKLYWRARTESMFCDKKHTAAHNAAKWNARYSGKEAFTAFLDGYKRGAVFTRHYRAHRIIWTMVHGNWPDDEIDHINGNRADNRISNLRSVGRVCNSQNAKRSSANTSGVTGVRWCKNRCKWEVQIMVNGRKVNLGRFVNKADAIAVRKSAERQHGFHANHGRS